MNIVLLAFKDNSLTESQSEILVISELINNDTLLMPW